MDLVFEIDEKKHPHFVRDGTIGLKRKDRFG